MIMRFELMNNDEERFTAIRSLAQQIQGEVNANSDAYEWAVDIECIANGAHTIEVAIDEEQE